MVPTTTDYLHGLRRLWWVPFVAALIGVALGILAGSIARPTTSTSGNALFTFRVGDPGTESDGSARNAEAVVAQSRLDAYVQLVRSSQRVAEILEVDDSEVAVTKFASNGGAQDDSAQALIDVVGSGVVEVRVRNRGRSQSEVDQLVLDLANEVVRQVTATDAKQASPSLRAESLITEPQATDEAVSRISKTALPVLLLLTVGCGIVYLRVWHLDSVNSRRDIEERFDARVLGDLAGQPADAAGIALALSRGRKSGTTALFVSAGPARAGSVLSVAEAVAAAGRSLGLEVTLTTAGKQRVQWSSGALTREPSGKSAPDHSPPDSLALIAATAELDADSLYAATSVDIVALIVEYGETSNQDLSESGHTLSEVTNAEIVVIGNRRSAKV